jgi:hypothetical protein
VDLERYYDALEPRYQRKISKSYLCKLSNKFVLRETGDKPARMARVSAQKVLLCLGDLARYKEQVHSQHSTLDAHLVNCPGELDDELRPGPPVLL